MREITTVKIIGLVVFILAIALLWSVNWKIAIGILLFGWAMNIENNR